MTFPSPDRQTLRNILLATWMTHDALWYGEVATKFGMAEASPMNLKVCRTLGRIEFRRAMKWAGASTPQNMGEYLELFQLAKELFVPEFMEIREHFLMGQIDLIHESPLAKKFMPTKPRSVSEFRQLVPLTTVECVWISLAVKRCTIIL